MPAISVVIPSYNHGQYIRRAIQSVLSQSFQDLEVIVVDDASTDRSFDVISLVNDERLRPFRFEKNQGAANATNFGIQHATGEFIAILNSDDFWESTKLEAQVEVMRNDPECAAVFSWANFIDEKGEVIPSGTLWFEKVFDQANRSRGRWLRRFYEEGNCLCHPSVLLRRSVYDRTGLYDERYRQLPDFEMWVRVCKVGEIHVIPERLVNFRILPGEANASSSNKANDSRVANETFLIFQNFFDSISESVMREGFGDLFVSESAHGAIDIEIEKAFLLLTMAKNELGRLYWPTGLQKLHSLLGNSDFADVLLRKYRFGTREFQELMGRFKLFADAIYPQSAIIKTGRSHSVDE